MNMATRLEKFRREMGPAKQLYTKELEDFTKKYDSIGNMVLRESRILILWIIFFLLKD